MSLRGHVSSNNGGRSEIKNLINELITEIEKEHGLDIDNFPERYNEIDEDLDLESKKSPKKGPEPSRRPGEEGGAKFGFFSAAGDPEP